jgi:hypothetical protein
MNLYHFNIDKITEMNKLEIKFSDFWDVETFKDVLQTDIPADAVMILLKAYYAFKVWEYINNNNYEWIKSLEWVLELHNLVKGTTEKV